MQLPKVVDVIAELAEELRRLKVGSQALNASAKLNLIELLAEKQTLIDKIYTERNLATLIQALTAAETLQRLEEATGSSLIDSSKVNYTCLA
ncbi:MAG: hypothetical protein ACK4TI_00585 [Nitrososphaerales archaeon]